MPIPDDPEKLANVTSISVFETAAPSHPNTTVIAFAASALVANPLLDAIHDGRLPAIAFGMPFRVPVSIHLPLPPLPQGERSPHDPHEIALAKVAMAPFSFPLGSESAQLDVSGHLVPAGNLTPSAPTPPPPTSLDLSPARTMRKAEPQPPLSRALSRFVARYLAGRDNDVFVRYDAHPEPPLSDDPSPDAPFPPAFVADLVRGKELHVRVPGTNETPELFRDLRMEDMRIKLGGGDTDADLLASGKVVGEVVMPDIAAKLAAGLDAQWIWPDVLVYDGDLPRRAQQDAVDDELSSSLFKRAQLAFVDSSASSYSSFGASFGDDDDDELLALGGSDSTDYPPSPVPPNAFARMRPSSAMDAETIHTPANATHNATTFVVATFVDAPLYLLPGRGDVLRRFVAKIIFGGSGNKVKASMAGITSVRIALSGFGEVELEEIPIEASFSASTLSLSRLLLLHDKVLTSSDTSFCTQWSVVAASRTRRRSQRVSSASPRPLPRATTTTPNLVLDTCILSSSPFYLFTRRPRSSLCRTCRSCFLYILAPRPSPLDATQSSKRRKES